MRTHVNTSGKGQKVFAEFFAGIGLVQMGLEPGGWECGYANDIELKKFQMYSDMFGESSEYHVEDIWKTKAVVDRWPRSVFLATASFPCVDLSLAGHWKGFRGEFSSTYFGFIEVLKSLGDDRPKLVMLENVVGFLSANKGQDFSHATRTLAELGYELDAIVLDAKWFVPQSRPRLFVFGIHQSISQQLCDIGLFATEEPHAWLTSEGDISPLRPDKLIKAMERTSLQTCWGRLRLPVPEQVNYALTDFVDFDNTQAWWDDYQVEKHYCMMERPSRERVDAFVSSGATIAGTAFRRTRRGSTRTEVRFDIAGCLRTPKGGSAKQIVVVVDKGQLKMRWMSAREYARLQGAANFRIKVPDTQAMYGFGDAVCVPAITWIDQNILSPIFKVASSQIQKATNVPEMQH